MGIIIEFNPDLNLRAHGTQGKLEEECLPEKIESGNIYNFIKKGQRNFWLEGEVPLRETDGKQNLSRPLASITIIDAIHYMKNDNVVWTRGTYLVNEVYDINDSRIHFEGMQKHEG